MSNNDSNASTGAPGPSTPETATVDLPIHSTPTVHKQSSAVPYTSGHVTRDETLMALGNEMVGYVVGPMPAKDFLELLPCNSPLPSFRKKPFVKLADIRMEPKMYDPFIKAIKAFCPKLVGINTSNTPMSTFSENSIKPDITYYNSSRSNVERADVESAELMVEVKFKEQDDPFKEVPTTDGFLCDNLNERARQTLGQMTSYATAHLAAQFRTHVFSILLFPEWARLMRWDRAGVVVSERIRLDKPTLAQFFWRFSNANDMERGHDPTVTPFKFTKVLTKEFLFNQLQFAADLGDVKVENVNFFEVLLPRENNRYVIGKATYLGVASLASRATRSFKAWCLSTRRPVFLKDTWRILSPSQRPEHEIYEKLAAAKVQHIATVLDYSDFEDHRTQTGKYAKKSWVCDTKLKPFRTLQHYRLVLKEIGRSLTSFNKFPEVLTAMQNALQAHRESYYNGRVLHRDISAGNIVIYNDGGLLIDWDMSKDLDLTSDEKNITRTGTWAFQSLRLSKRPKKNQAEPVHGRLDDLESFYHVLFWVSLRYARHELSPVDLYDDLARLFDHALIDGDKTYSNPSKLSHMTSTMSLERAEFQNPPLRELLLKLSVTFKVLYISPPMPVKIQSTLFKKVQQDGESYQTELEIHKEQLNLLSSDENPEWMEISFEEALQYSDDEWGPTGYISNEITPPVTNAKTKRKFSDMKSSNTRIYSQSGTFLPSDQSAEDKDDEDGTEDEDEDDEDYDEENDEENDQPPLSRRRLD